MATAFRRLLLAGRERVVFPRPDWWGGAGEPVGGGRAGRLVGAQGPLREPLLRRARAEGGASCAHDEWPVVEHTRWLLRGPNLFVLMCGLWCLQLLCLCPSRSSGGACLHDSDSHPLPPQEFTMLPPPDIVHLHEGLYPTGRFCYDDSGWRVEEEEGSTHWIPGDPAKPDLQR
jgi:hypothetical protein